MASSKADELYLFRAGRAICCKAKVSAHGTRQYVVANGPILGTTEAPRDGIRELTLCMTYFNPTPSDRLSLWYHTGGVLPCIKMGRDSSVDDVVVVVGCRCRAASRRGR